MSDLRNRASEISRLLKELEKDRRNNEKRARAIIKEYENIDLSKDLEEK